MEEEYIFHNFFLCDCFAEDRRTLASTVGVLVPDIILEVMLNIKNAWEVVASYVHAVLRVKRKDERLGDF